MGDAIVADVRLTLERLLERGRRVRPRPGRVAAGARPRAPTQDPITGTAAMHALARTPSPTTGSSCSRRRRRRWRCATSCGSRSPGSYYFGAGGGLGFGLSAAVGVQLAQPDRPVVCVIGEGSVQYAVTAFWSAVAYDVPVTFLRPAQQRVRDPQVVLGDRGGRGRARARPAGARHRRDRRRLRGRPRRGSSSAEELREALGARDRRRRPAAGRGRGRAGDVAVLELGSVDGAARAEGRAARAASAAASADAAPDWVAAGTPEPLRSELVALLGRRPGARRAPPTSSATPPTPAPTGCSRRRW